MRLEKKKQIIWFSIEDIAVLHSGEKGTRNDFINEEKEIKRKKNELNESLLSPITMQDRVHFLTNKEYSMKFNPREEITFQPLCILS